MNRAQIDQAITKTKAQIERLTTTLQGPMALYEARDLQEYLSDLFAKRCDLDDFEAEAFAAKARKGHGIGCYCGYCCM